MYSLRFIVLKLLLIITLVLQNSINNVITVLSVDVVEKHAPIVQGYVYCKSCKHNTLVGADPLPGAVVRLECNSNTNSTQEESTTNKNGYFAIKTPSTTTGADVEEQCKVVLVSPSTSRQQKETTMCTIPTDINSGVSGAVLKYSHKVINKQTLSVKAFTVGPFAFQPQSCSSTGTDGCDPQCLFICAGCCHCTY